jgi:hypothetical protein
VLRLERADFADVEWDQLDAFEDRNVFQTREWLEFLAVTQGGEPVIARVLDGDEPVGWYAGMKVKRFGVPILGSPFRGWTTGPIGFNLREGASRGAAVEALGRFAFGEMRCLYLELLDRRLAFDEAGEARHSEVAPFKTFEIDLSRSEDELFAAMSSACRRAIRKSEKVGVQVELASGEEFADEYYEQLEDVFAKQSLSPPYSLERVREMIRLVEPSGNLLMLRARNPDGKPIASAIFPVFKSFAYFWGGASFRSEQIARPNEAVFWYAIRHVKELGVPLLDLGGQGEYKRKYGGRQVEVPFLRRSRLPGLLAARKTARKVYWRVATRKRSTAGSK